MEEEKLPTLSIPLSRACTMHTCTCTCLSPAVCLVSYTCKYIRNTEVDVLYWVSSLLFVAPRSEATCMWVIVADRMTVDYREFYDVFVCIATILLHVLLHVYATCYPICICTRTHINVHMHNIISCIHLHDIVHIICAYSSIP